MEKFQTKNGTYTTFCFIVKLTEISNQISFSTNKIKKMYLDYEGNKDMENDDDNIDHFVS